MTLRTWATMAPRLQSALRIVAGLLFMMHGGQKLLGWFGGIDGRGTTVEIGSLLGLAGILEFFGGGLIALGVFTQPIAFVLAGEMAVAYFKVHYPRGLWPIQNGGELAALYSFIWLYFSAAGPGAWIINKKWK